MKYQLSDYDFDLPPELIAKAPLPERTASRMLVINPHGQSIEHSQFNTLIDRLSDKDLIVFNDTKVIPARIYGNKTTGGRIECLLERLLDDQHAWVHLRSSKSPKPGSKIIFNDNFEVEVEGRHGEFFIIRNLHPARSLLELFEQFGSMPLPPYIDREATLSDTTRYQTVFAKEAGAVAAPTASLHFDQAYLQAIKDKGIETAHVTLHVGAGTFQPVRVDDIREHPIHSELITVSETVCEKIKACKARGGRVIAVGTTVMRSLETAAQSGGIKPYQDDSNLFIYPGFTFHCVDALLTNFHLPKSSLMMLVSAFAGYDLTMQAYQQAVKSKYRFFSYGDCVFISNKATV